MALAVSALPAAPSQAQGPRLRIVASFGILADVIGHVTGDAADVEALIPLGAEPHSFEPSAQDIVTLSEADMVFVAGLNLEEGLLPVLREATSSGTYYEVWACVPIRPVTPGMEEEDNHAASDTATGQESPAGTDQADSLDALCDGHYEAVKEAFGLDDVALPGAVTRRDTGYLDTLAAADPHVWTDPVNVALWTVMIRDMVSAVDPAHAETYAANASAYLTALAALDDEIAALIAGVPEERRTIVTNHVTLNYFAARYGLTPVGVVIPGGSTVGEPSAQDVIALIETIQQYGVPVIFTETTVSEDLASQIADEVGATIAQLYTESLSEPDGPAATYLDYMRYNATQVAEALK
jgi:ABC-type Zn uptake system ZnuABC Zn-binding protein ZnuA